MYEGLHHGAAGRSLGGTRAIHPAAFRLVEKSETHGRNKESAKPCNTESPPPAPQLADPPADQESQKNSDVGAKRKYRHRRAAPADGVQIRYYRVRWGVGAAFSERNPDARNKELPIIESEAADGGHHAEQYKGPVDDPGPVHAVRKSRDRYSR